MTMSANDKLPHPAALPGKHFTVAEADRSLVLVERIVADVVFEYALLLDLQDTLDLAQAAGDPGLVETAHQQILASVEKLHTCLEEMDCVGVQLRDWSLGVVDFPALGDRREFCLCWRAGESRVAHWHDVNTGCEARETIETLPACRALEV